MQPQTYFSHCILMLVTLFNGLFLTVVSQSNTNTGSQFWRIHGYLCINSNYTEVYAHVVAKATCASICTRNHRCQAFTINDGPCQLFVFDRCSKSVRNCNCTRTGQVFVKQQPGLAAGALCPDGYGDDLCGVKYKVYSSGSWWTGRTKCESESGLVIMTDVTDDRELQYMHVLYSKYSRFFVGAYQPPGSEEPYGGWHWVGCNITFDPTYWAAPGEPSSSTHENFVFKGSHIKLGDASISHVTASMCECLSPFN